MSRVSMCRVVGEGVGWLPAEVYMYMVFQGTFSSSICFQLAEILNRHNTFEKLDH